MVSRVTLDYLDPASRIPEALEEILEIISLFAEINLNMSIIPSPSFDLDFGRYNALPLYTLFNLLGVYFAMSEAKMIGI